MKKKGHVIEGLAPWKEEINAEKGKFVSFHLHFLTLSLTFTTFYFYN